MNAETIQKRIDAMFPGTMGVKLIDITKDRVLAEMPVREDLCTAGKILHGGAYMAFADTLGAVGTIFNMPADARTSTIESKTNFMGSAPAGSKVIGESTPLHRGRTTQVWTTRITSESGKLLAVVTQTQIVMQAAG